MKRKEVLDRIFKEVESVVLSRQHPVTGLLPASTSINTHGDYRDAWVRDNVYSILCVWILGLAYRHFDDPERRDQLEQATIKLMRGLLMSMMRQAGKVEAFKQTLDKKHALHAKYDTTTGLEVVADDAWGHLQVDATSIYLLMLAQMTASGLRIVRTFDEVDFVQNLVYYIASAYRTPDFGIWERGNKINNGKTEINASSVGMAKAALQALDGFNLFGKDASPRAVVHSVADAISLARHTLAALLPRESLSKETDSALLSIIGFPAFAVGDKTLVTKTRDNILAKLGGNYGCKRFLWDGHQTVLEESSRLYYEHSELANFEHIESEWPLFFTYLYIHALFDGNESTARHYRSKIESLMVEVDGKQQIPELYYVPRDHIELEKQKPRSQPRLANENVPLVWAQSLFYVGLLLDEGLVSRDDVDPLRMRRRSRQFTKTQIALVVLAENDRVKAQLAQFGVIAETLQDIRPINVITASSLVETYRHVGANRALSLTGRPQRRLQSLATSQSYEVNGKPCLCLSWIQNEYSDYRVYDAQLVAQNIERELSHIATHWMNQEIAVFTWMVDEHFCNTHNADVLFRTLRDLQLRTQSEQVGYASAKLAIRASRVNRLTVPEFTLVTVSKNSSLNPVGQLFAERGQLDPRAQTLLECLDIESELTCYRTLDVFLNQYSLSTTLDGGSRPVTVADLVRHIYYQAQTKCYWLLSRFCYACLGQFPLDLTDGLTMLVARHMAVVLGKGKINSVVIDAPMAYQDLVDTLNKLYFNPLERALAQEFLTVLGTIMRVEQRLFDGLRSVMVQNLMMLCAEASDETTEMDILMTAGAMSPARIQAKVRDILDQQHREFTRGLSAGFLGREGESGARNLAAVDTDWFEWRVARGSITRLDDALLNDLWQSLHSAQTLVFGDRGSQEYILDCERVRSSMTPGEVSFGNHIDQLTQHLHPTYYKSAVFEALYTFTLFCKERPGARFSTPVVFSQLLERAAKSFIWDSGAAELGKRDLDVLLEQAPQVLQKYVSQVFEDIADDF
jgi:phosphorylase kinase alpha/beta subunit